MKNQHLQPEAVAPVGLVADVELDLRGEVCPLTFVRTKIALEDMRLGQVLKVWLDYEPASRNVPMSVHEYGDAVLAVERCGGTEWAVWIRKTVE